MLSFDDAARVLLFLDLLLDECEYWQRWHAHDLRFVASNIGSIRNALVQVGLRLSHDGEGKLGRLIISRENEQLDHNQLLQLSEQLCRTVRACAPDYKLLNENTVSRGIDLLSEWFPERAAFLQKIRKCAQTCALH
jgi:hypothetical protein